MAPKQKITREEILQTAFTIVRNEGIDKLNARDLAKTLNCSTQPIFSSFENMEVLKEDIHKMAVKFHTDTFIGAGKEKDIYLDMGYRYVKFAWEEPNIFKFLFMSDNYPSSTINDFVQNGSNQEVDKSIGPLLAPGFDSSSTIFTDMWLYAHGISSMIVFNQIQISLEEIEIMLERVFQVLLHSTDP